MTTADYEKCAGRLAAALDVQAGERVVLKVDPRLFAPIIGMIQDRLRGAGASICGAILAEASYAPDAVRNMFEAADIFIWLPELHQGNTLEVAAAIVE